MLIFGNSIPTERNKIKHKTPSTHCGPIFKHVIEKRSFVKIHSFIHSDAKLVELQPQHKKVFFKYRCDLQYFYEM